MIELGLIAFLGQHPIAPEVAPAVSYPQEIAQAPSSPPQAPASAPGSVAVGPTAAVGSLSFAVVDAVFSIAPAGGSRLPLTSLPGDRESGPIDEIAWSPGGQLAAVYNYGDVYLWQPGSPAPRPIFNSQCMALPNLDLVWSNGGNSLLIQEVCDVPNSQAGDSTSLYIVDTPGATPRRLTGLPANPGSSLYVSPDGSQVAYVYQSQIYRLDVATNQVKRVTRQEGLYGAAGSPLAWSPDGTQLAFFEGRYPNQQLNVIAINGDVLGNTSRILTPDPNFQIYRSRLYWSPDSQQIAFYQPVDPPYDNREILQLVTVATGEIKTLSQPGFYDALSWAPDGRKLVMASGKLESQQLFILDLATGVFTPLTTEPLAQVLKTLWAADGSWIAFSGEPAGEELGNQTLFTVRPDGRELRSLTSPDEYAYPFAWQP